MQGILDKTNRLMELLGHDEAPFGVYYDDVKPEGYGPKPGELFTREREIAGEIDWHKAFGNFSCIIGNIWLARKKKKAAWISHEECGCMGGGYYTGLYRPFLETNVAYVSTGMPEMGMEGEHYLPNPECMREFMREVMPPEAPGKYCIFKPLDQFGGGDRPLVVNFFARPEVINGLYSLTMYATGDYHSVVAPFGPGCSYLVSWPLVYQQKGEEKAVLGGLDISARKFMKTDELTYAVPLPLYEKMLDVMEDSALTRHTWQNVRKKVAKSIAAWDSKTQE
ncbi:MULTISPECIES: DUF169 domain-containing protein [unclassified Desulfovibrio]|uniref:DUF169 domain-containing protein n=1 Tax=unclassified Desulfovibrio TaxID=2593640 RepID=UPI002FDB4B23